ncbi:MAG: FecR family protein [Chitinophagaceae bacterium]
MKDKNELDRLFVSYLLKELNTEEEEYVVRAIGTDDELKKYFEEFQQVWTLLQINRGVEEINLDEERMHLERIINERQLKSNPGGLVRELNIEEGQKKSKIFRILRKVAVAASVLFLFGMFWLLYPSDKENIADLAKENPVAIDQKSFVRNEKNNSGKTRQIKLDDGSEIILWNQSEISFAEPFADNKRDIQLKGKASFKVFKDKSRPFTVFSGALATTALGTEFTVTNFEKDQLITVRLSEGSVVVNSVDGIGAKLNKPFYLLPGQELLYNKRKGTARIRNFQTGTGVPKQLAKKKIDSSYDNPSIPKNVKGSWYMFNNQSLPDIFDQLEKMFGTQIVYKRKDVQSIYFIGRFGKSDSLEYILKNITTINKLTLTKEKNRFVISK